MVRAGQTAIKEPNSCVLGKSINRFVSSRTILSQSKQTRTSPISSQFLPISPITEIDPFDGEESDQADGVVNEENLSNI